MRFTKYTRIRTIKRLYVIVASNKQGGHLTVTLKEKGRNFADFMAGLTQEQIDEGNRASFESVQNEFERFKADYTKGLCYLCHKPLKSFSKESPCIHWLLKPNGFKKKNFIAITEKYGYFQIQSLLRWYANVECFGQNINSLKDEGSGNKLFEVTIKYLNLEWSFSCAPSDYLGHESSKSSNFPHYHFQMRIDKRPFIGFNDFHIAFSDMDVINIEAIKAKPDHVRQRYSFGEGMEELLENEEILEKVVTSTSSLGEELEAPFKLDSFVFAEKGKTINGDDLYEIIQEAKSKGVSIASLLHKLPNAQTQVLVSPGPGVVEQAPRTVRKMKDT